MVVRNYGTSPIFADKKMDVEKKRIPER